MTQHLLNPSLLDLAFQGVKKASDKTAFVPSDAMAGGGDPAAAAGGGGGAPPPGGDPSAGAGGAAPAGPPPVDPAVMMQLQQLQQQVQQMQQGGGAGGAGGAASGAPLKPKIDVNVELMQIKNMLAKICDAQGIAIPAQDMVATPEKLMAMSQGQSAAAPPQDPAAAGGGAIGGIPAMDPMQGAGMPGGAQKAGKDYRGDGAGFNTDGFSHVVDRVAAIRAIQAKRKSA